MRYSPTFWLLPYENYIEGNLDRDTFRLRFHGMGGAFHAVS